MTDEDQKLWDMFVLQYPMNGWHIKEYTPRVIIATKYGTIEVSAASMLKAIQAAKHATAMKYYGGFVCYTSA